MSHSILYFLGPIFMRIGATLTFDFWALFLKYAFKITPSNMCLVGRWILHMAEGKFLHSNINAAPHKEAECIAGWITHYMVGVIFTITFIAFAGSNWLQHPTLVPALIFGVATATAPLFIMQPAFGFGFAASKTSNPIQARVRSLTNHTVFGIGLYLFGLLVS